MTVRISDGPAFGCILYVQKLNGSSIVMSSFQMVTVIYFFNAEEG
jgi:hypothetical protein